MNEDETFRILARRPIEEVCAKVDSLSYSMDSNNWWDDYHKILNEMRWTRKEYIDARYPLDHRK